MTSSKMQHVSRAVFDQEAFYPFRRLVEGALTDVRDLERIERFLRAAVLHDEMDMELEPAPDLTISSSGAMRTSREACER
ncbi:MAG TPA: hypothetical protein VGC53_16200 [Vicinamibacteria bacterium]